VADEPGDAGAHGRFDERSRERSLQLVGTTHRGALVLGAGLAGAAAAVVALALSRGR
jgi:hypothetical protein